MREDRDLRQPRAGANGLFAALAWAASPAGENAET